MTTYLTCYDDAVKVLVVAGTGRTGRLVAQGALARGHAVTVLGGEPGSLPPAVYVVRGDVRDGGAVSDAVDGQDAAVVVLADAATRGERDAIAPGTLNVVRSMQRYRVPRLVVLSASLVSPEPDRHLPWPRRHLDRLLRRELAATLRRTEVIVRQSELDWTLVRAAALTNDPPRGRSRSGPGYSLPGGAAIARADLAAFLLDELEHGGDVGHAVAVAS